LGWAGVGKDSQLCQDDCRRGYIYGKAGISGILLCARQFMNSLADSSLEECKRAIEDEPFLAAYYEIGDNYIKSRDGRIQFAFAGLDRNIASIKSKGRILLCWVDEAEPVTDEAFMILIPTLAGRGRRLERGTVGDLEPQAQGSAVRAGLRLQRPAIKVVELNWRDNPKFPASWSGIASETW
jgi:phage terminase large subunit